MADRFHACRFWPDCRIHLGQPAPRAFSAANVAEMAEDLADGARLIDVAARFATTSGRVAGLVRIHHLPEGG